MTAKQIKCSRTDLLAHALEIREEYAEDGLSLTLRQMYYQCVARGFLANGQKHYKRIGDTLTVARYAGDFPLDGLVDRGRIVANSDATRHDVDVSRSLDDAAEWVRTLPEFLMSSDRWYGQPNYVSCWVEKEALAEVFEQTCNSLGVGWFACRGYPSVSSLYQFMESVGAACNDAARTERYNLGGSHSWRERHAGQAKRVVILYFGDHDPDGWEIPRSAERNLARIQALMGTEHEIEFRRIALNMDQILSFNPPPFPAKASSSRFAKYYEEHNTNDAWELDALEPRVLRSLITSNVEGLFDEEIHARTQADVRACQAGLRAAMTDPDFWSEL